MRRMVHLCLAGITVMTGISPALAADPPHDLCSDSLVSIEMRDTAALHAYARFIEADMAGLNGVARGAGTGTVDFSDPRWGTPQLRGQQVAALCRRSPRMPFQEAVLRVYHGYRVSSGLGTIVPPGARR